MSLRFEKTDFLSADLSNESSLPPFSESENVQNLREAQLDEDDGLFIGYGFLDSIFPYKMQDGYSEEMKPMKYLTATLENEYLKAVFLPDFGGRLWSLYDKKNDKELLYRNNAIRPRNLAVRNAWLAGGIEFNCGMVGHGPYTCSTIFTAETKLADGTPVLRMYEFERIRGVVYQMDFFLPDDSRLLFGRMKIINRKPDVVPMYWWTNIALPEGKEYRNVIPAHSAYTNTDRMISKVTVPLSNSIDITYPTNNPIAVDYFWKLDEKQRRFTAYLDKEGSGFFQASTFRLQGRKLFVWGQGKGGTNWQKFLTEKGCPGRYTEIQAGIARTQYECLPMPPKTTWEWLECYGAVKADGGKIHGEWDGAIDEVNKTIDGIITEEALDRILSDTKKMSVTKADKMICQGSGWGKLENMLREKSGEEPLCLYLDFGDTDSEQADFLYLLNNGRMPDKAPNKLPVSWIYQKEWTKLLENSKDGYDKFIHLAAIYFADKDIEKAEQMCRKAIEIYRGPAVLYILSQIKRVKGVQNEFADLTEEVRKLLSDDISVTRMAFSAQLKSKRYENIIKAYKDLCKRVKNDGRVKMLYGFALLYSGNIEEAETVLNSDGGLCVADICECETTVTELYLQIEEAKAKKDGRPFDASKVEVPEKFDFRMFV